MALSPQFTKRNGVLLDNTDNFNGTDNYAVLFANGVYPEMGFTIKVDTSLGDGLPNYTFSANSGTHSIYWGDGTAEQTNTTVTHTYSVSQQYEIALRGTAINQWTVNTANTSREKLIDVLQWKNNGGIGNSNQFANCDNLVSFSASDAPADLPQTNFVRVFDNCDIWNGDLSNWDMSGATTLQEFFRRCPAFNNSSINNWDVSNVNRMSQMFLNGNFTQDISGWNTSKVTNFTNMFQGGTSNPPIGGWDVSGGGLPTNMSNMFGGNTGFNQDISGWDVSNNTNFGGMFGNATSFNQNLADWDTSSGTSFTGFAPSCPIGDLTNWDVSGVTSPTSGLNSMFQSNNNLGTDPNISNWKLPSTPFSFKDSFKFCNTITGGDITTKIVNPGTPQEYTAWDVSSCTNMHEMWNRCFAFNGDCSNWDVSNVLDFSLTFSSTSFNQDISSWTPTSCTNMSTMFQSSNFNQDISGWNVGSVTNFSSMFGGTPMSFDLSGWDVSSATTLYGFIGSVAMSYNYGAFTLSSLVTIGGWASQSRADGANSVIGWAANPLTNTGVTAAPLWFNSTLFSKSATVGVEGYDGQDFYGAYSKMIAPTPNANRTTGTNTSTATDTLIDSSATFLTGINVGDVVKNVTTGDYATVETIDSDTQITLSTGDDIFVSVGDSYSIDGGFGWVFTGVQFS